MTGTTRIQYNSLTISTPSRPIIIANNLNYNSEHLKKYSSPMSNNGLFLIVLYFSVRR